MVLFLYARIDESRTGKGVGGTGVLPGRKVARFLLISNLITLGIISLATFILFAAPLRHYSYLASIPLYAGASLYKTWHDRAKALRKEWRILITILVLGIIFTILGDGTALQWGAWGYGSAMTLNAHTGLVFKGAEWETVIFGPAVFLAVVSVTLVGSAKIDAAKTKSTKSYRAHTGN